HRNLGTLLTELGRYDEAKSGFQSALKLQPDDVGAYFGLAVTACARQRLEEGVERVLQVLMHEPRHVQGLHLWQQLVAELQRRLAATPAHDTARLTDLLVQLHNGYGVVLARQRRFDEAIRVFRQALAWRPDAADVISNFATALIEAGADEEAKSVLLAFLRHQPGNAGTHIKLGYLRVRAGEFDAATDSFRDALRCKPDSAEAYVNLGAVYERQGRLEEAIACCERALGYDANNAVAHCNLGMMYLRRGEWEQGWAEYEWRLRCAESAVARCQHPRWDGSSLSEKTILLECEQGLGDSIQFVRFAPLAKRLGGRVVLECPPPLIPLLSTCAGVDSLVPRGAPRPAFDVHAPLLSVPGILKMTPATIPPAVPYLSADAERAGRWQAELSHRTGYKVGLIWRGSGTETCDRERSIPLAACEPLARMAGVVLYSLQRGGVREDLDRVSPQFPLEDLGRRLDMDGGAFLDTAAVMKQLDLIVTVDSAPAHLAGALGVPVWVLLGEASDWRWLLNREDSVWYPTMRLFRRAHQESWHEVLERVAQELATRVAGQGGGS
ncbi:MAG: tetratricopeptide repeat protein, partial [Pirellulaceae bacterium]